MESKSVRWWIVSVLLHLALPDVETRLGRADYATSSPASVLSSSSTPSSIGLPPTTATSISLPKKPSPAPGAFTPTTKSYTSTTGLPFDHFSGMSLRQLDIVRTSVARIFQLGAQSAKVDASRGAEVFLRIGGYIDSLWFPGDGITAGFPSNTSSPDGGGQKRSATDYWSNEKAYVTSVKLGTSIADRIDHLLSFDPVGYTRVGDDDSYKTVLGLPPQGPESAYLTIITLHTVIDLTAAADYILGSAMTDEILSALKTVFRFIRWRASVIADLYERKIYSRYEGPEQIPCAAIAPADLVPAYVKYPIMSIRKTAMQYASYGNKSGPVNADGTSKKNAGMSRQIYDDIISTEVSGSSVGILSKQGQVAPSPASIFFPQPPAAEGATPLSPPPYAATAGKNIDQFSGMPFDQLAVALETWKNVIKAAAAAAGVAEADGSKVFEKQWTYTLLLSHAEYSGAFGFQSIEDIWTNVTLDATFAMGGMDVDDSALGMTQNNAAMTVRTIDRVAFRYYVHTRQSGEAWYTLPFFAWRTDAYMEAVHFFLGDALTDEAYSALESIFNFVSLKTYEVYHYYNKGYRVRPFADDLEMVGIQIGH